MSESRFKHFLQEGMLAYSRHDAAAAMPLLEQALAEATTDGEMGQVALLHRRFGRLDEAVEIFRRIIATHPDQPGSYLQVALADVATAEETDKMVELHRTAEDNETRAKLGFALGKIFQDSGDFERSYSYYADANASYRAGLTYSTERDAADFETMMGLFSAELFAKPPPPADTTTQPIFIVGLPRSGSTLLEQILASHPSVLGGGEMSLMVRVQSTMKQHAGSLAAAVASIEDYRPWAAAYMEPMREALQQTGKQRFTDKQLDNFRRIGLIKLMFPNAKIIHCVRNPLDHLFTIWRRTFAGKNIAYGYDQQELGAYYKLYAKLMSHWDRVLPGFVYHQRYEDMIANPEPEMRRLLAYCNLDWDPACLDFHRTERGVATNSFAQVRKPLYADSVGMAEPYRHHLGPLIEAAGL